MRFLELKFPKFLQALLAVPLFLFLTVALLQSQSGLALAEANTCAAKLQPTFTGAQAQKLCANYGTAILYSLIPSVTNTIDVGSTTKRFRDGWFSRNVDIGGTLGVTGTSTFTGAITLTAPASLFCSTAGGCNVGANAQPMQRIISGSVAYDADITSNLSSIKIGVTGDNSGATNIISSATGANAVGSLFYNTKTRSTGTDADTVVQSGDALGEYRFYGADGAAYRQAAVIRAAVDGTPGSSDMPGRLIFQTTPDGSATPTDTLILYNTKLAEFYGDVSVPISGKTISLQEGTPASACMGLATPNGTSNVTVTTTCGGGATARVLFARTGAVTNMGNISLTASPNGTQFTFASTGASDTLASSVLWIIVKEA